MARVVQLTRTMLGDRDRDLRLPALPGDGAPGGHGAQRLLHATMAQESPESSLFVLRHGFTNLIEVARGPAPRLPRVSFRLFYAHLATAMREIAQSTFFNPLHALEFRPEFDRIPSTQVLELIHRVPGEQAHRLVALTFLALFRMLRYLRLLDAIALDHSITAWRGAGTSCSRSCAATPARSNYLRRRAAGAARRTASSAICCACPRATSSARHDELAAEGYRLLSTKAALSGLAVNLRLEMRRAFEHDLPPADALVSEVRCTGSASAPSRGLRPALQNAILFLGRSLGAKLEEGRVFDDRAARRATSDRLRRDVWMFAQIARAFASKARNTGPAPDIDGPAARASRSCASSSRISGRWATRCPGGRLSPRRRVRLRDDGARGERPASIRSGSTPPSASARRSSSS